MVWIDPDRPDELFGRGLLWSATRPAPLRFRNRDYGLDDGPVTSDDIRDELAAALPRRPNGPVRMLSQPRRWGWLFNPITLYFAWDDADVEPVGVVAEVTNTPWKERHRYPVALSPDGDGQRASFAKVLHVSPFLDEDYCYELRLRSEGDRITVELDVVRPLDGTIHVATRLSVVRTAPTAAARRAFLVHNPLAAHRVSAGIHIQAARLLAKRVPFIAHPRRRTDTEVTTPS